MAIILRPGSSFPPQMVVFGDSSSDAGRRFNAPASFDFDGIGPFPWTKLFESPDSDVSERLTTYLTQCDLVPNLPLSPPSGSSEYIYT